jgi:succinate dehydrogenase/fumarate reductase flavoprotein subunit
MLRFMHERADIVVVGGAIAGLAHADVPGRKGKRVALFGRGPSAAGASVGSETGPSAPGGSGMTLWFGLAEGTARLVAA